MTEKYVKKMADEIRRKISGGSLLGNPVDENDMDAMIVAAYHIARGEKAQSRAMDSKKLRLRGIRRIFG